MSVYDQTYNLIIGSSDINATPGSNSHTFTVPVPLIETPGEWKIRLVNVSFPNIGTADNSVFVYCNLIDGSTSRLGGQLTNILFRTRPIQTTEPSPIYIENIQPVPVWFPLVRQSQIQSIKFTIEDSAGNIPSGGFSIVQVQLVKV